MNFSTIRELTRPEQNIFGFPILLATIFLSFSGIDSIFVVFLVIAAFLLARTAGMVFNQVVDCEIDAKNPRTRRRVIPSNRISKKEAFYIGLSLLFSFVLICFLISNMCGIASLLVVGLLIFYSYLKRFTLLCHFVLGFIHFLSPVLASIALCGGILKPVFFLGLASACLIMGSDIIYSLQDYEFDMANNLFSLPAKKGRNFSIFLSRILHISCVIMLTLTGVTANFSLFYYFLIFFVAKQFIKLHREIEEGPERVFLTNAVTSLFIFGFISVNVLWDAI